MHVSETKLTTLETVSESGVIESEAMENRRLQVVDVDGVFGDVEAEVVGRAVNNTWLDSTACHPD